MRIGCSSFGGSFASLIEWLQYQDDSMKTEQQEGNCDDYDRDDRTYRTTERTLLIRHDRETYYNSLNNMISDFLVRTTSVSFVLIFCI